MMNAEPQQQHRWLEKLAGEWEYEMDAPAEPGEPPQKLTGIETVRSVGGIWILAEGRGAMPGGGEATTLLTLGFDPARGRFVGTWLGSMMSHLWVYDGELDASEQVLSLYTEGPDMSGEAGKLVPYKDVIELVSDDHRILAGHSRDENGEWQRFMEAHYRRKK